MEQLKLDIIYALKRFQANPLTTAIIIITLALGIGASSAIFSVVNGLMLRATPFDGGEHLVHLTQADATHQTQSGFSVAELSDFAKQTTALELIAEYHNMTFTLYHDNAPVRVRTGIVSQNFFPMLSLQPLLGRLFNLGEDQIGAEPMVLLSYEFWQQQFNGRQDIINTTVEMNNKSHKIIGVLPPFPQFPEVNDIYMAIPSCPWRSSEGAISNRSRRMITSFAKISPQGSLDKVNQQLQQTSMRLQKEYPESYSKHNGLTAQAVLLNEEIIKRNKPYLITLMATTLLLLIIASANATNLILSQHAKRRRELAVRASLGASQSSIARMLFTESLMLGLLAGIIGLLIAFGAMHSLQNHAANFTHLASQIHLDGQVLGFILLVSVASGVIAGMAPMFAKINLLSALKDGGKASFTNHHGGLRNMLLIIQFALSLTLLVAAGLAVKSLQQLQIIDRGYQPGNIETVQFDLNWSIYQDAQQQRQFTQTLLSRVRELPFVESAGASVSYPQDIVAINSGELRDAIQFDDRDFDPSFVPTNTFTRFASSGYFETLGASLISGRFFDERDDQNSPKVTVVSQRFAELIWPNQSPLNHRISFDQGKNWVEIIGVVKDLRERSLALDNDQPLYFSIAQYPASHFAILAKLKTDAKTASGGSVTSENFKRQLQKIVASLDPRQAISKFESLQQALDNSLALQRLVALLLSVFAFIAIAISVSGISGVMAYLVSLRTREIGIRMAIGADRANILWLMLKHGLLLTSVGLILGMVGAYGAGTLLADQLFQLNAFDLTIYSTALFSLFLISILSCLWPAVSASSISPTSALKS